MDHSSLPPLEALEAVLAAERGGSFTAAAERLGITHGAVSRRIAAVEQWHGTPVFERHGRGVRPTVEGQRLLSLIERALDIIASGAERRGRRAPEPVRLSIVPSFARLWLIPRLAALEGDPPDLRLDLQMEQRFADLSQVDLAVRYGRGGWRGVVAEPLFAETLVPVATPALAAALGPAPALASLLRHPLIHEAYEDVWQQWLAAHGESYRPRAIDRRLEDHDVVLLAAAAGHGIALLRRPYGEAFVRDGRLVPLYAAGLPNPQCFHLVMQPGHLRPAVERLVARLRKAARTRAV
ncbi:MAG TPA: LysR substrate-binding domain-containing protein [Kiloniellales bacterium]|nr:LysR substrate-binding domain-containing protein [Kiloniellales bacterium]